MTRRLFFFPLFGLLAGLTAWTSPEDERYTRLARISYIEGYVSFQHTAEAEWAAANVNLPLVPGDRIYTGPDGRAEIEFDDGSICRLAENTDLEILSLDEELVQLRLLQGLSSLNVSSNTDFEVNTPAAAFNPTRRGIYRFDVVENGDTDAIVRKGELEAANNDFSQRIESGELLHIRRTGDSSPAISRYDRRDLWDEWNDRRDADMKAYLSRRYLPDNVSIGASDLDRYGRWVNVETYGTAWVPFSVDVHWTPYSIGRWCYRPFFGWTWVSYEPWGWLPYHYGRWYRSTHFGWCWLPGPSFAFNFWSPGLVVLYSGNGWISWCPLGPGDYYNISHYHYNRGIYSYQLNWLRALHTRPPGNHFHRNVRGAYRIAHFDQFRNGSFRDSGTGRWGNISQPWREGSLVRERLNIQPTVISYSAAPHRPAVRPRATSALPVVVRANPERDPGNRGRFTRISNPQIPPLPSRMPRNGNSTWSTDVGSGSRADSRVIEIPHRERERQGDRATRSSPWTRRPENPENRREDSGDREGSSQAPRSDSRAPDNQNTNPRVPAFPSGARGDGNAPGGTDTGNRSYPNSGVSQVPQRERTEQGGGSSATNSPAEQGGSSSGASRWPGNSGNPGNRGGNQGNREGSPAQSLPGKPMASSRQETPRWRYERITPEEKPTPQLPAETRPSGRERQSSSYAEPRQGGGTGWNGGNPGSASRPSSGDTSTNSTPRQSTQVPERSGTVRSYSAPSQGSNSANAKSSSGGSSRGGSLGRWGSGNRNRNE